MAIAEQCFETRIFNPAFPMVVGSIFYEKLKHKVCK